ncbi:MAG TPA: AAC(3) family N-acetyltransferase [Ignavibacteriales bacterium]|nr:AAC(3) family N-acetyltransferase [Ignavibacteriales bacterium]HRR17841.1 AAC(3) family N-acetyltransferase [Ignavibacteriales bacterium]
MKEEKLSIKEELAEQWKNSGINEGDIVLIHSDLKRTLFNYYQKGIKLSSNDILESFIMAVGKSGTLLFPLFNFDFTKGVPFDIRITPSHMGALTEAARKYPTSVRTGHPIYSFAVIGNLANKFSNIDNYSAYGADSPFAILTQLNGKIAILDLPDQNSMTFYHHIEEINQVDYRYHKEFSGLYTDIYGITKNKTYSIFVRDLERNVVTHVNPMGELLWKEGLYKGDKPYEKSGLRVINARNLFDFVTEIIKKGKALNLLYKIEKE